MTVTLIQVGAAILVTFASALVLWAVYMCVEQPLAAAPSSVEIDEPEEYSLPRAA